jgi:hypothetical protein
MGMVDVATQARSAKCGIDYQLMPVLGGEPARKECGPCIRVISGRAT